MAAYGLYTHIQSNKRRSIALLIGLFFLVYVMVFAGALLAEAHRRVRQPAARLSDPRGADSISSKALPFATVGTVLWIADRLQLPPVADRRGDRRAARSRARRSRGSTISWKTSASRAASPCRSCAVADDERAQRLRHRPQRETIFHHGHARPDRGAQRPGDRSRARPRAHPYSQRRRAHAGDRGGHRRRDLFFAELLFRHVLPERLVLGRRRGDRATATAARAAPASPSSSRWR